MAPLTIFEATRLSSKILSIGLIVNSLEYFFLIFKKQTLESFPWRILKRKSFSYLPLGSDTTLKALVAFNFMFAILLFNISSPIILGFLFLIQWLFVVRFGGTFNGGSDSLQLLLLFCLFLHFCFDTNSFISIASILYLAVQVLLSYLIAGLKKFKSKDWLTGKALQKLAFNRSFSLPSFITNLFQNRLISTITGYLVLVFELSFVAILIPKLTGIYFLLGFLFHLINFFIFGLNRFFFAWMATYPILLFFVQFMQAKYF